MSTGLATGGILTGSSCLGTDGIICFGAELTIASVEPSELPDNGGVPIIISGLFVPDTEYTVDISDPVSGLVRRCYSGVVGQGNNAFEDGGEIQVIAVPFPIGGPYDIILTPSGGLPTTTVGVISVVHRDFVSTLLSLRSSHAPMRPRNVGPGDVRDED